MVLLIASLHKDNAEQSSLRRGRRIRCNRQTYRNHWPFLLLILFVVSSAHSVQPRRQQSTPPLHTTSTATINTSPAWLNSVKNGLASAGAAACCKTLLHPIDCIKTLQQYSSTPLSVVEAFTLLYQRNDLYAGLLVTVLGSMPSVALYFGVYSYTRQELLNRYPQASRNVCIAVAAAVGNTIASASRVPYETAKQRLQMGAAVGSSASLFSWSGMQVQMLRDIPYAMCTLVIYETLQQRYGKKKKGGSDFVLGGIAGGMGSWLTNPLDVIKTRVQTAQRGNNSDNNLGIVACIEQVWKEGGARAFLRGSVPRLAHKVPANAFFFLFYELFKRLLGVETLMAAKEINNDGGESNKDKGSNSIKR